MMSCGSRARMARLLRERLELASQAHHPAAHRLIALRPAGCLELAPRHRRRVLGGDALAEGAQMRRPLARQVSGSWRLLCSPWPARLAILRSRSMRISHGRRSAHARSIGIATAVSRLAKTRQSLGSEQAEQAVSVGLAASAAERRNPCLFYRLGDGLAMPSVQLDYSPHRQFRRLAEMRDRAAYLAEPLEELCFWRRAKPLCVPDVPQCNLPIAHIAAGSKQRVDRIGLRRIEGLQPRRPQGDVSVDALRTPSAVRDACASGCERRRNCVCGG